MWPVERKDDSDASPLQPQTTQLQQEQLAAPSAADSDPPPRFAVSFSPDTGVTLVPLPPQPQLEQQQLSPRLAALSVSETQPLVHVAADDTAAMDAAPEPS